MSARAKSLCEEAVLSRVAVIATPTASGENPGTAALTPCVWPWSTTSIGRYQVREPVSPLSSKGPPKKSLNSLSIAVCRPASSPIGLQRLNAIFPTPPVFDEPVGSLAGDIPRSIRGLNQAPGRGLNQAV